jgi:hypothetical protein
MEGSTYLLPVIFMGAISAAAAIGAIVMAIRGLGPQRFSRDQMRALTFQFPDEARRAPDPARQATAAGVAARPASRPSPPPPPARLDLALLSPGSPQRLRIPVAMASGRILELGLPLHLSTRGGRDLEDVRLKITMPTELTFGASLDRMTGSALALPGARAAYASGPDGTVIDISLPKTPGGAEVEIPIPVCVKGAPAGTHTLAISAEGGGLDPIALEYRVEIEPDAEGEVCALVDSEEGLVWICRPVEDQRQRDPALPLDRIARFRIEDAPPTPPPPAPEPQPEAQTEAAAPAALAEAPAQAEVTAETAPPGDKGPEQLEPIPASED